MIKTIFASIVAMLLLSACDEAPMPPSGAAGSERVTLDPGAGMFDDHPVAHLGKNRQMALTARLSQPRRATKWSPMMSACVQGADSEHQACIRFVAARGSVGMVTAVTRNSGKRTEKRVPGASFRVDQIMTIVIKPQLRGYSVVLEGVELYSASTDFDVLGLDLTCSSAKCAFDVGV